MIIHYYGPFAQATGYARAMHDNCMALLTQPDITLQIFPLFDCDTATLEPQYDALIPHATTQTGEPPTHVIVHAMPLYAATYLPDGCEGARKVCFTTWETDRLPEEGALALDHFDRVIVPSTWAHWAVLAGDENWRVRVVPHALDVDCWVRDDLDARDEAKRGRPYTFYSIGDQGPRKNFAGLLTAYYTQFYEADTPPLLRLLAPAWSATEHNVLKQSLRLGEAGLPPVEIITERLDREALYQLHATSDCYVSASRGEAWALGLFEACAVGNPTISPDWGGHLDYIDQLQINAATVGSHIKIDFERVPAVIRPILEQRIQQFGVHQVPVPQLRVIGPSGVNALQQWAEPRICELMKAMKAMAAEREDVTRNYSLVEAKEAMAAEREAAVAARNFLSDTYNYAAIGAKLVAALRG